MLNAALAQDVLSACEKRSLMVATAESCTGGMIIAALTDIAGSSSVVERGFITYTNEAKKEMLGVPDQLFKHGAVSMGVACAMAQGAINKSNAQVAVAVTGVAGPGGGTDDKPVGLVHIAVAREGVKTLHKRCEFDGDRAAVRKQTVHKALTMILDSLALDAEV